MYLKKVKLINHDCLPILMLLYIVLAYLMLFAALTNAVCLYNASFFAIDFCKCFVFVYFFFFFASCTVLLICLFFLILCSHRCRCCFFFLKYIFL